MAGAGYRLFNTGDVLTAAQVNTFLQEQVVMRFANAAARTTALSGVLAEGMMSYLDDTNAVQVYNGSAWVNVGEAGDITAVTAGTGISGGGISGDVTITNSMATAIDAKGDLIAGTADNAFSRLAVGNNGDTLLADSSTSTGLRWQPTNTGNFVINGAFDYWQRATTFTQPSNSGLAYGSADRFRAGTFGASGAAITLARSTDIPTSLAVQYSGQLSWTAATSADLMMETIIENGKFLFAGQTVTVSFYAKSSASQAYDFVFDQDYGTTNLTIGTSWARYSYTITLPTTYQSSRPSGSSANDNVAMRFFRNSGTATRTVNITGIQVEVGSVPTAFRRSGNTLAGELAACQRYYWRTSSATNTTFTTVGNAYSTTNAVIQTRMPVTMRVTPTALDWSTLQFYNLSTGTQTAASTVVLNVGNQDTMELVATVSSGLVSGNIVNLRGNGSGAFLGFSAEL